MRILLVLLAFVVSTTSFNLRHTQVLTAKFENETLNACSQYSECGSCVDDRRCGWCASNNKCTFFFPFVLRTARLFDDALTHLDSTQVPSVERIPRKPEHVVIGISITVQEKVVQRIRHVDLVLLIPIAAGAEE